MLPDISSSLLYKSSHLSYSSPSPSPRAPSGWIISISPLIPSAASGRLLYAPMPTAAHAAAPCSVASLSFATNTSRPSASATSCPNPFTLVTPPPNPTREALSRGHLLQLIEVPLDCKCQSLESAVHHLLPRNPRMPDRRREHQPPHLHPHLLRVHDPRPQESESAIAITLLPRRISQLLPLYPQRLCHPLQPPTRLRSSALQHPPPFHHVPPRPCSPLRIDARPPRHHLQRPAPPDQYPHLPRRRDPHTQQPHLSVGPAGPQLASPFASPVALAASDLSPPPSARPPGTTPASSPNLHPPALAGHPAPQHPIRGNSPTSVSADLSPLTSPDSLYPSQSPNGSTWAILAAISGALARSHASRAGAKRNEGVCPVSL